MGCLAAGPTSFGAHPEPPRKPCSCRAADHHDQCFLDMFATAAGDPRQCLKCWLCWFDDIAFQTFSAFVSFRACTGGTHGRHSCVLRLLLKKAVIKTKSTRRSKTRLDQKPDKQEQGQEYFFLYVLMFLLLPLALDLTRRPCEVHTTAGHWQKQQKYI